MEKNIKNTLMKGSNTLKEAIYVEWVKLLNTELAVFNECMSCFTTDNARLERWYEDKLTPKAAAMELHFIKSAKRNKCMCEIKKYK